VELRGLQAFSRKRAMVWLALGTLSWSTRTHPPILVFIIHPTPRRGNQRWTGRGLGWDRRRADVVRVHHGAIMVCVVSSPTSWAISTTRDGELWLLTAVAQAIIRSVSTTRHVPLKYLCCGWSRTRLSGTLFRDVKFGPQNYSFRRVARDRPARLKIELLGWLGSATPR
jgi:hypothetical protein